MADPGSLGRHGDIRTVRSEVLQVMLRAIAAWKKRHGRARSERGTTIVEGLWYVQAWDMGRGGVHVAFGGGWEDEVQLVLPRAVVGILAKHYGVKRAHDYDVLRVARGVRPRRFNPPSSDAALRALMRRVLADKEDAGAWDTLFRAARAMGVSLVAKLNSGNVWQIAGVRVEPIYNAAGHAVPRLMLVNAHGLNVSKAAAVVALALEGEVPHLHA